MVRWLLSVKRLEEETVVRECSRFFCVIFLRICIFYCTFAGLLIKYLIYE